jgi:uncharacterized peroxidase-related enzyme
MSWIRTIDPAEAVGELAAAYERIAGARGGVAEVHRVQSLNPRALLAHFDLYRAVMFQPSPLSRAAREALAVTVSEANGCAYCVAHHAEALRRLGEAATPPLPETVLAWARRLARNPETASAADIDLLRRAGLDDRAILDAVLTVAYFCYVNRIVLALGVRLEPDYERTCGPS